MNLTKEDTEFIASVSELVDRLGICFATDIIYVDTHVNLDHLGQPGGGTLDFAAIKPDGTLIIVDLKTGRMRVNAAENLQLADYASGFITQYLDDCPTTIVLAILQPAYGVSTWQIDAETMAQLEERITDVVDATRATTAQRNPGEHCRFCKARGTCYAINVTQEALVELSNESLPDMLTAMPPAALKSFMSQLEAVAAKEKAVRETVYKMILDGTLTIDGYNISAKSSKSWASPEAEHELLTLADAHDINPDDLYTLVSPAQAKKLFPKSAKLPDIVSTPGAAFVKKG